jgi:hypothetical protein
MASPIHKVKYGTLELAIWEKESKDYGKQLTFSISKSFQNAKKEWQNQVFYFNNVSELINVVQCAQAGLEFRFLKKPNDAVKTEQNDEP